MSLHCNGCLEGIEQVLLLESALAGREKGFVHVKSVSQEIVQQQSGKPGIAGRPHQTLDEASVDLDGAFRKASKR